MDVASKLNRDPIFVTELQAHDAAFQKLWADPKADKWQQDAIP